MSVVDAIDQDMYAALRDYLSAYASRTPVERVAVVGNAPLVPSKSRQEAVDGCDLVFRCNSFVLDEPGVEPTHGTKTDVVVAAYVTRVTPWFFRDYASRAYLAVDVGNTRRPVPRVPLTWPDDLGAWPISNRIFGIVLKRLLRPETDGVGAVPTTGTTAAYVAHELFPDAQLLLTGFSYLDHREQTTWKHHWGTEAPVHPAHLLDREGALLQSWVDDGSAVFIA